MTKISRTGGSPNPRGALYDCVHFLNGDDRFRNTPTVLNEEHHLKVLRLLQDNPALSQRELARALGISLGKTNYCVRALLDKGLIKMQNFRNSSNKLAYAYLLTPAGIAAKADLARRFLQAKRTEYEALKQEIARLERETHP